MKIVIHPHATKRMKERGATKKEVQDTIKKGETFTAKFGRVGFRKNVSLKNNNTYTTKQVEVYAVKRTNTIVVITVITKYF